MSLTSASLISQTLKQPVAILAYPNAPSGHFLLAPRGRTSSHRLCLFLFSFSKLTPVLSSPCHTDYSLWFPEVVYQGHWFPQGHMHEGLCSSSVATSSDICNGTEMQASAGGSRELSFSRRPLLPNGLQRRLGELQDRLGSYALCLYCLAMEWLLDFFRPLPPHFSFLFYLLQFLYPMFLKYSWKKQL